MEATISAVATLVQSSNTLFILMGAIMVLAMHAGFAFLEVGTVSHKNQVNALVKIMTDFGFLLPCLFFCWLLDRLRSTLFYQRRGLKR